MSPQSGFVAKKEIVLEKERVLNKRSIGIFFRENSLREFLQGISF